MKYIEVAKEVLNIERSALDRLSLVLDETFEKVCDLLLHVKGRVIVIGMGKSGHVGVKIASTLASTGTPAFFIHPAEAGHGDFGMIVEGDLVLALSNSGKTPEILQLIPLIKHKKLDLIAITNSPSSPLVKHALYHLYLNCEQEACPHNLAPTATSTATLVLGDMLAMSLLRARNFSMNDFAFSHPSGALGKRLLLKVSDLMVSKPEQLPLVSENVFFRTMILEMTSKSLGMAVIINQHDQVVGVYTDGDLRRTYAASSNMDVEKLKASEIMVSNPKLIYPDMLAVEALKIMERHKITSLVVANENKICLGVLHLHQLMDSGI